MTRDAAGQAAVEVALVLPLVAALLLLVVQVGLVVRDQVLVVHAAREAARAAAVDPAPAAARRAAEHAARLDGGRLDVRVASGAPPQRPPATAPAAAAPPVATVTATVSYRSPTLVPLVGALLPDLVLRASASMRQEF